MYIKTGSSTWKNTAQLYIKTTASVWERIRQGYIKINSTTWKRFFYEANLPVQTSAPTIRTTNTSGSGTIYDGPVATSPQRLDTNLFGKDGTYTNYTSIYGRKFTYADTLDATSRTTVVNDDRFTSAGGVTTSDRIAVDGKYLFYELTVSNGGDDQIYPVSNPIKMIRDLPEAIDFGWTDTESVGNTLYFSYSIQHEYYRRAEISNSKIRWWRSTTTNPGGTLLKEETLTDTGISTGSTFDGTSFYTITSSDVNYYVVAEIVIINSYTRHYGYTNGISIASFPTVLITPTPDAFTYSLTNISSVTTPSTPSQQRVSSTSNTVLFEVASTFPSDTYQYGINQSGAGASITGTPAQYVTQLNGFNSSGDFVGYGSGSYDALSTISNSASNSPFTISTIAYGNKRVLRVNTSTTGGAQSWAINFSWTNASPDSVIYYNYGTGQLSTSTSATVTVNTNSMPVTICDITGANDPTVTINNVTAYSSTNLGGASKAGTAGSPTSLSSIARPTATSGSNTVNYTYYTNYQATGNQRRVNLPSNFTSGTTVYVSTNGFIGIGADPAGNIFPSSSGLYLMPLQGDQRQTALWTYADASNFYVRWQGARYNDSAQTIDYQAKFYWNSTAVDVYFVTNNLSSSNPASTTAVYNNGVATVNWSGSTSQSSTLFSTGSMTRNTSQDSVDDNRTAITASIPVSPPVNITTPAVTPTSATAGSTFSCSTGGWTNSPTSYSYQWQYFEGGAFGWLSISGQTSSTFVSTGYGGLSIRCIVTATNSGGSVQATSNQASVTSAPVNRTAPTISNVVKSGSSYLVYFSGGTTGGGYQVWWQGSSSTPSSCGPGDAQGTSSPVTVSNLTASAGSTYYFFVRSTSSTSTTDCGPSSTASAWSSAYSYTEPSSTPSIPGTPTLTYVSANNTATDWGYSASWGASTGSGTIQYQIACEGNSGGTATKGLFSTNSASFTLPKTNNTWRIRVRATNNGGSTWSDYSGYSTFE